MSAATTVTLLPPSSLSSSGEGPFDVLSESERFEYDNYSCLSADVSESESGITSSGSLSHRGAYEAASSSSSSSTFSRPYFLSDDSQPVPVMLPVVSGRHVIISSMKPGEEKPNTDLPEAEMMKERFAKLLLGEDMSGGGEGVSTALAISNAITNLSASVFGELWKLERLAPQKKAMWHREMEWLLCVSDSIVELTPSLQDFPGGGTFEVMVTRPRSDLYVNLPALKKLDAMLLSILDGFQDSQFCYVDGGIRLSGVDDNETYSVSSFSGRPSIRQEEKWWLPFPKVPPNGLSENVRKKLQQSRECTNQILKAAMAINSSILAEMETPNTYLENLPKSGKDCLGEAVYRYVTADQFSPEHLFDCMDLSSEYTTVEVANRIEAAMHIWKQKYAKRRHVHQKSGKSSWGGKVKVFVGDVEKCKVLAQRAESLLHNLKLRFPGLPQTSLDMTKMQCNKDVGHSILESYSRVLESIAFNIMARIDDLLYVDDATKQRAAAELASIYDQRRFNKLLPKKNLIPSDNNNTFPTREYSSSASPVRVLPFYSQSELAPRSPLTKMINLKDSLGGALEKLTF